MRRVGEEVALRKASTGDKQRRERVASTRRIQEDGYLILGCDDDPCEDLEAKVDPQAEASMMSICSSSLRDILC